MGLTLSRLYLREKEKWTWPSFGKKKRKHLLPIYQTRKKCKD